MLISMTFSTYVARLFIVWFASVLVVLVALIVLFDVIELLRRAANREEASFGIVLAMSALKIPNFAQKILPFATLFGTMIAFWRLNRSHELVVARAAGVSVWQFLFPVLLLSLLIGVFKVTLFNPFASAMLLRFEQLEASYIRGKSSLAAVATEGIWLRQTTELGHYVIHAPEISPRKMELRRVIVFLFEGTDKFIGRIDAPEARLDGGYWLFDDARLSSPDGPPRRIAAYRLATEITPENIYDSFASPETMSFWALPRFIEVLEKAGFSGLRHKLHWYAQLADPVLLCSMVLIAAAFSMPPARRAGTAWLVIGGIGTGFVIYFLTDVVHALGASARLPVLLAAWAPASVSMLLGVATMFHLEDG